MGKDWDTGLTAFSPELWREVRRVLKPGAHLLACGGTRTYHRLTCAIEDAGFEIRDCLAWLYGSGFPKSLNLGDGLGTALKPAHEPIVLARKPFKGTVAANVEKHGTGALNIDACRVSLMDGEQIDGGFHSAVPADEGWQRPWMADREKFAGKVDAAMERANTLGRWPANVVLDDLAAACLDEQSGESTSNTGTPRTGAAGNGWGMTATGAEYDDVGGASRFFYCAKPSREERDMGCWSMPVKTAGELTGRKEGSAGQKHGRSGTDAAARNYHPTVKPVELMRWLVRLVTPIGGICLDPFLGSGTTGMAAKYEQREFIGIEREAEYVAIAERRIAAVAPLFDDVDAGISSDRPRAHNLQASLFPSEEPPPP
jgi:site-specific DNA-methyltransferase (adenine-specific)